MARRVEAARATFKPSRGLRHDVGIRIERHADVEAVLRIESEHFLRGLGEVERRFRLDPGGFFRAVDDDGTIVGICATAAYPGGGLAWIGGMNVPPEHRRKGIARSLLHACMDHGAARGADVVGLDATTIGRPLYLSEGFADVGGTTRWVARAARPWVATDPSPFAVYPMSSAELPEVTAFDRRRFGANRAPWIAEVVHAMPHQAFVAYARGSGALAGFVLGQERFVGPLVADDPAAAHGLFAATTAAGTPPLLHLMDDHEGAVALARAFGLEPTESRCIRMARGGNLPGDPATQYGIAAWALG